MQTGFLGFAGSYTFSFEGLGLSHQHESNGQQEGKLNAIWDFH